MRTQSQFLFDGPSFVKLLQASQMSKQDRTTADNLNRLLPARRTSYHPALSKY